jgi:hypothetical protein
MQQKRWAWLIALVAAIGVTVALVRFAPFPFVWVFAFWIAALLRAAWRANSSTGRAIWVNAIVVLALFLVLEVHWVRKKAPYEGVEPASIYSDEYIVTDPLLGFGPSPGHIETVTKVIDGTRSYAVTYTIGADGLRRMPDAGQWPGNECLLFFGGSFTFGEGVEDNETLPYLASRMLLRRALNFGFHAYGPNQMLIAIEQGDVLGRLGCEPVAAVYQAIPDHVKRVAGLGNYGDRGPRYAARGDGHAVYEGQFSRAQTTDRPGDSVWADLFGRSYIYREYFIDRDWIGAAEVGLYLDVVRTARERLHAKYPGIEFTIIFWDTYGRSFSDDLDAGLAGIADRYVRVTEVLPGIADDPDKYRLPGDAHPNALAYRLLAERLAAELGAQPAKRAGE